MIDMIAQLWVDYLWPGLQYFAMFMAVMGVLAFWSKVKEGKILEVSNDIFHGTITYTYKTFYYTGIAVWTFFLSIFRVFRVIFATLRDFFMSRI